jgi:hypothetical protein
VRGISKKCQKMNHASKELQYTTTAPHVSGPWRMEEDKSFNKEEKTLSQRLSTFY